MLCDFGSLRPGVRIPCSLYQNLTGKILARGRQRFDDFRAAALAHISRVVGDIRKLAPNDAGALELIIGARQAAL